MITYTALTTLPGQDRAEALGAALEALDPAPTGVGVFEIEDASGLWEVGAYFLDPPDDTALALLSAAFGARPFTVSEVPETDWVAKVRRDLAPVRAGRFFVFGSHDADKVPADVIPLRIEAAMAFGTGHHGTTKGCLLATETLLAQGFAPRAVADIGCGTAVLAMAAARVWDAGVIASDIDPVAVEVALSNLAANALSDRIVCVEAAGFDHPALAQTAPFDLVYANILKGPLVTLAPDLHAALAPGGRAILSGLLTDQAPEVIEHYVQIGFNLQDQAQIGEWATLILHR
jgi:ribosomal protein L11 methyltransferase